MYYCCAAILKSIGLNMSLDIIKSNIALLIYNVGKQVCLCLKMTRRKRSDQEFTCARWCLCLKGWQPAGVLGVNNQVQG